VASHRLSNEAHYDFAMRALKSVLLIAAQLRSNEEGACVYAYVRVCMSVSESRRF